MVRNRERLTKRNFPRPQVSQRHWSTSTNIAAATLILTGLFPISALASWSNIADVPPLPQCNDEFQSNAPCLRNSPHADVVVSQFRVDDEFFVTLSSTPLTPPLPNPPPANGQTYGPGRALVANVTPTQGHLEPLLGENGLPERCDFYAASCTYRVLPLPNYFQPRGTYWTVVQISTDRQVCDETNGCRYFGSYDEEVALFVDHPLDVEPPVPLGKLQVELEAYGPDGESLEDQFSLDQTFEVEVTLSNVGTAALGNFSFTNNALLERDGRSPGGAVIVSGPTPAVSAAELSLGVGEERTFTYQVTTTARGLVALNSKVLALTGSPSVETEDARSLKLDIEDGAVVAEALEGWIQMEAIDAFLIKATREFHEALDERADRLRERLAEVLSPEDFRKWFGDDTKTVITPYEYAIALLTGSSAKMVDARLPDEPIGGFTVEQLNNAYNESFKKEVGKGLEHWAENWAAIGKQGQTLAKNSYRESLLATYYMFGNATQEERQQFEAKMVDFANRNDTSFDNLINTVKREIPEWRANGTYLWEAIEMSVSDATLQSPDLKAQIRQEAVWRENMIRKAEQDPVGFQKAWAKRDAEIFNLGVPVILDTIIGGTVVRAGGSINSALVGGEGASVLNAGKAMGVIDEAGAVVPKPATSIARANSSKPSGIRAGNMARTSDEFLENLEGATVVRASDAGKIYELPNLGGVPETTLEAKAVLLGDLEAEYAAAYPGTPLKGELTEMLKTSSPLRKPGGVGKLELAEQKTGKPAMLDAGMPGDSLGEAGVWRNTTPPAEQPGWESLSKPRQEAALKEWDKANKQWDEWQNPPPGSKTERLQQCIGQRCRVPLDLEPKPSGLQRFVTAEFELVEATQGTAQSKSIRVKYYESEVFDTNRGIAVDTRVVVDSPSAVVMGPDADAVGVFRRVGTDASGRPIIEPLTRQEREFLMPRYIKKNIAARRSGLIPDAAEHGVTAIMDDASARVAGKLQAKYYVPFLPESTGARYLKRIAKYVKPPGMSTSDMLKTLQELVESEGGYGQKTVLITKSDQYLGEVAVQNW